MYLYLCVIMYTCMKTPTEAKRGIRSPGAEDTGVSDLPSVGADIRTLQDQQTLLTTEPFLLSQTFQMMHIVYILAYNALRWRTLV